MLSIDLGIYSNTPSPNTRGMYRTGAKQALKAQVSYTKKWSKCLRSPLRPDCFHTPSLCYSPTGRSPRSRQKRQASGPVYRQLCTTGRRNPKAVSYNSTASSWDSPETQWRNHECDHFGNEDCSSHEYFFLILFVCLHACLCVYIYSTYSSLSYPLITWSMIYWLHITLFKLQGIKEKRKHHSRA